MTNKYFPGTVMPLNNSDEAFSTFRPMIEATGGLSLSQICSITGLQTSTIQNWAKRGYIPRTEKKRYGERHLSRILLISALKDCMTIERIADLMMLINGDTDDISDDIISESTLYDYFVKVVSHLDLMKLSDEDIEKCIHRIIQNEDRKIQTSLMSAMKVMVYGYIIGDCLKALNKNLEDLRRK